MHVIDAGHTDDDRPYLVMEYVEGVPIDVYAGRIQLRDISCSCEFAKECRTRTAT